MTTDKLITAKYPGKCRNCGREIEPGDRIYWRKGTQPKHADCTESILEPDQDEWTPQDDGAADPEEYNYDPSFDDAMEAEADAWHSQYDF